MAVSSQSEDNAVNMPSSVALVRFYSYLLDIIEKEGLLDTERCHTEQMPLGKRPAYRNTTKASKRMVRDA